MDQAHTPAIGKDHRYARRVGPDDLGQRVSVRHLVDDAERGQTPTDTVGRLIGIDDEMLLIVDREARLRVVQTSRVLASRVVPEHPRLPPEPHVGTREVPLVRHAGRILLFDRDERVLLIAHLPGGGRRVWTAPGGGLARDEDHRTAAIREVREELAIDVDAGASVMERRATFAFRGVWIEQHEQWFLSHIDAFDPADAPLGDAGTSTAAWWTVDELRATGDGLGPATLADHVAAIIRDGPPGQPWFVDE